jgi:TonB family protein
MKCWWRLAALTAFVATAAWSQENRPPVELVNPTPAYPVEAWGSGIDPEVTVEVGIDARGRVSEVEVVSVRPSSAYDDVFARAVQAALRDWRYAPRIEAGQPAPAQLRWTLEFLGAREGGAREVAPAAWWATVLGLPRDAPTFLTMPHGQRVRLLEEHVGQGVALLASDSRSRTDSPRFVVHTDAGEATGKALSQNLEATFTVLDDMFARQIPPRHEPLKVQVFGFSQPAPLSRLAAGLFPSDTLLPGFYSSIGLIAITLQLPTPGDVLELLLHEGTHAYVDRHLVRPGVRLPYWLAEGLAEYIGNSEVHDGRLVPGRARRARYHLVRMVQGGVAVTVAEPQARLSLEEVRTAVRRGKALTLTQMLDADRTDFYGDRLQLYYGMSWLLVHYLRHGEAGWSDGAFPRFLLYAAEGFPIAVALEATYGRRPDELQQPFEAYVDAF